MERLFVDTSAWYAFANRADPDHRAVSAVLRGFSGRVVTTDYVFDETVTLCRNRLGHPAALAVGSALRDPASVDLVRVTGDDQRTAWQLFSARADQRYSFTDCTSFALLQRIGIRTVLALDADFATEGFSVLP